MKTPVVASSALSDVVCLTTKNAENVKSIFLQHHHSPGVHAMLTPVLFGYHN
ncbi:hypothetical protein ES703_47049 [subsurface metagenome]